MKLIIAPTDFSDYSLNGVKYAAAMAASVGAKLLLLHVVEVPAIGTSIPPSAVVSAEMIKDADSRLNSLIAVLKQNSQEPPTMDKEIVFGNVNQRLMDLCKNTRPFAVVMGLKKSSGSGRLFFGSRSFYASEHIHFPIIIVPEKVNFNRIVRIGIACDFEVSGDIPFGLLKKVISAFHAQLHLIHVTEGRKTKKQLDKISLESSKWQNELKSFQPQIHVLYESLFAEAIVNFAKVAGLDLLISFPRRPDFPQKIFRHAHSQKLMLKSKLPVMTIHD